LFSKNDREQPITVSACLPSTSVQYSSILAKKQYAERSMEGKEGNLLPSLLLWVLLFPPLCAAE